MLSVLATGSHDLEAINKKQNHVVVINPSKSILRARNNPPDCSGLVPDSSSSRSDGVLLFSTLEIVLKDEEKILAAALTLILSPQLSSSWSAVSLVSLSPNKPPPQLQFKKT